MITKKQYVEYLLHTPINYTGTNLANHLEGVSHDNVSDYLAREKATARQIWELAKEVIADNADGYPIISFEDYSLEKWQKVLTINLTAPFMIIQAALPLMKTYGGKIINMSSTGGHLGSRDIAYSSSKAGLIGLTKSVARSLAKYNITVNAIAPGMIKTKMSKRMSLESINKNLETVLIKRPGLPSDIVGVVSFLLSKDSDYITGFTIDVNGGLYIR